MDDWLAEYRTELLADESIPVATLARILQRIANVDDRDLRLASTLTSKDVLYLDNWQIWRVIEAEVDEAQVEKFVESNKARYVRMAELLPAVFGLLKSRSNFGLRYTIQILNDLAHDFGIEPTDRRRRDKVLNDRLKNLHRTRGLVAAAAEALKSVLDDHLFAIEHQRLVDALRVGSSEGMPEDRADHQREPSLELMVESMRIACSAIDIVDFDLRSDNPRELQIDFNMTKADVVARAYDLHRTCGGPPLVTTPGSDFSLLCSLIYEMCTGERDQSLAGAIIRFSTSRDRRETDEYEQEIEEDEQAFQTDDNFYLIRKAVRRCTDTADWYVRTAKSAPVDKETQVAMLRVAAREMQEAVRLQSTHGPFIVWASQEPRIKNSSWRAEYEESHEKTRQARILLGEARRLRRGN